MKKDEIENIINKYKSEKEQNRASYRRMKKRVEEDKNKIFIDGVLITLVDQPLISVSHYNSLLKKFKPNLEQIVVSV